MHRDGVVVQPLIAKHHLGNLAESMLKVDRQLQEWMQNDLGWLPEVPTEPETPPVDDGGGQLPFNVGIS